jgi:serine protease
MGVPATVVRREEMVSTLVVKLRETGPQLAQAQGGAYVRSLSNMAGLGVKAVRPISDSTSLISLDAPMRLSEATAAAARLASDPAVLYAEPDRSTKPFATPTDTDFNARQWNLFAPTSMYTGAVAVTPPVPAKTALAAGGANLPTAWDVTMGSNTVVLAIIDTGISNHLDLNGSGAAVYAPGAQGRFLPGYDFVSLDMIQGGLPAPFRANDGDARDNDPTDPGDAVSAGEKNAFPECDDNGTEPNVDSPDSFHGTLTAGIAAANSNNSYGVAGIAWNVKVLPVRALGKCGGSMVDMADAIRWAAGLSVAGVPANPAANVAKVIYIGAGTAPGVACGPILQTAIDDAINAGSTIVAPTGNHGELSLSSPSNCNGVIAVTSHSINGESASEANIGPNGGAGPNPSISAPGGGSPSSLGALGPIDDPNWAGFYIWSTAPGGTPAGSAIINRTGTSLAAAQVAGVAALIKTRAPNATPAQIKSAIMTSARPHPDLTFCAPGRNRDGQCGIGLLDATRALQAAGPPVVVTAPKAATVAVGATASFTIEAIGVVSYQWTRAGVNIAGATGPSYTTPALAATDNNVAYAVVMTNSFGTTTSSATVTVQSASSNSPSKGGALPLWQLVLLSALLVAGRVRVAYREQ